MESESGPGPKTDSKLWSKRIKQVAREIKAIPMAAAIAFTPTPREQIPVPKHNAPLVEPGARPESPVYELKSQIEEQYDIKLSKKWNEDEIVALSNVLNELPTNLIETIDGKQLHFEIERDTNAYGGCECAEEIFQERASRANARRFPAESERPRTIVVSADVFSKPDALKIMVAHELVHDEDTKKIIVRDGEEDQVLIKYHADVERIVGMPFADFGALVNNRLKEQYPLVYETAQTVAMADTTDFTKNQINPLEIMTSPQFKTFNKVARWAYAVGYLQSSDESRQKYPMEFLPVMAEWYRQGPEYFYSNTDNVIAHQTAQKLYDFVKQDLFSGVEYGKDGHPIKGIKRGAKLK